MYLESKAIDHLGLIAGMWDKLELGSTIDNLITQDRDQRNVSIGTTCKALVIMGLGFSQRTLYMVSRFFENKPVDVLLGNEVISSHLNDTVLGRALDDIHDFGCTKLFAQLTPVICKNLGLRTRFAHMDSTDFHVDGKYNSEHPPSDDQRVIHITKGYSRDHRPDLNQVVLNLITENKAGIPLHMEVLSGNASDKEVFKQTIKNHIDNLQNVCGFDYLVMDSAGYTLEGIKERHKDLLWISRVPESIKEAQLLLTKTDIKWVQFDDQHKFSTTMSSYAGVAQRWLMIFSQEAYNREYKTLVKNYGMLSLKEYKAFLKLSKQEFSCKKDAQMALDKFVKAHKYLHLEHHGFIKSTKYPSKGRPGKTTQPSSNIYQIEASASCSMADFEERAKRKGKFIIATNQLNAEKLTDGQLLKGYKQQSKVERGFRFLKDPQFVASSLFVKKPQRVEALLFIMTLCLTVYAALEHDIRKELKVRNQTIPNQIGKQINNPTTRWVFQLFNGIHLLYQNVEIAILNIKDIHKKIIQLLGVHYHKYYFLS